MARKNLSRCFFRGLEKLRVEIAAAIYLRCQAASEETEQAILQAQIFGRRMLVIVVIGDGKTNHRGIVRLLEHPPGARLCAMLVGFGGKERGEITEPAITSNSGFIRSAVVLNEAEKLSAYKWTSAGSLDFAWDDNVRVIATPPSHRQFFSMARRARRDVLRGTLPPVRRNRGRFRAGRNRALHPDRQRK